MAGEMTAGHVDRFFVDRCGDNAVDTTKLRKLHSFLDEQYRSRPGLRRSDSTREPPKGMIERVQHGEMIPPWRHRLVTLHSNHVHREFQALDRLLHNRKRADDQRTTESSHRCPSQGLRNHLGTDPGRISHGDSKERFVFRPSHAFLNTHHTPPITRHEGCSKTPDFSPAQPWRAKTRLVPREAAASAETKRTQRGTLSL